MSGIFGKDGPNWNLNESLENVFVKVDNSDETTATKLPLNLSDMPIDVVEMIIERSDYKEQLILQKVSKSMRSLVDKQTPNCTYLSVSCGDDYIRCDYNNRIVVYTSEATSGIFNLDPEIYLKVVRDDYEEVAFEDLKWTLSNPKLQLDRFCYENLNYDEESIEVAFAAIDKRMETILKSLNHQLLVKEINIGYSHASSILTILPYLKPGFLETIYLATYGDYNTLMWSIDQISSLDQWKQAQELKLLNVNPVSLMQYATHFKRFDISLLLIEEDELNTLRDHFSAQDNFEYCTIHISFDFNSRSLVMAVGVPAPPIEQARFVRHYAIPNSDYHLEFLYVESPHVQYECGVIIVKKKNNAS